MRIEKRRRGVARHVQIAEIMQTLAKARSLDTVHDAIAAVAVLRGPELIYEVANRSYCRLVGSDELRGRSNDEISQQLFARLADRVYTTGEAFVDHELALDRDGTQSFFDTTVKPLCDVAGAIVGVSIFAVDITAHVERRLEAEHRDRAKDEFLAIVSHELRNPLMAVLGWTQCLRAESCTPAQLERALEKIERNAIAQSKLIDDLLDIPRITNRKVQLELRDLDLASVVRSILDSSRPAIEARELELSFVYDPATPRIYGDEARLSQVIWNLVANAVKFARRGGRIDVVLKRAGAGIELSVTNDGEGIPADLVDRVFELFTQVESCRGTSQRGLGLGLWISKDIVELHGGTIRARSDGRGRGATFIVQLPGMTESSP
jgi:signal transduction histidine kinase